MGRSEEFNRDGEADVKKVVTKSGPLGYLPLLYLLMSLLFMMAVFFFMWRS
jgi:hypothetical protein